jgi:hypothetical protein
MPHFLKCESRLLNVPNGPMDSMAQEQQNWMKCSKKMVIRATWKNTVHYKWGREEPQSYTYSRKNSSKVNNPKHLEDLWSVSTGAGSLELVTKEHIPTIIHWNRMQMTVRVASGRKQLLKGCQQVTQYVSVGSMLKSLVSLEHHQSKCDEWGRESYILIKCCP